MSLADRLIPKLRERFPDRGLKTGTPPEPCAVFPAAHPEVGGLVIRDDGDELTLYVGDVTHIHFSNFDDRLTPEEKAEEITEDIIDFLEDMFADRYVMWGSNGPDGGGGLHHIEKLDGYSEPQPTAPIADDWERVSPRARLLYVWSGPIDDTGRRIPEPSS